MNATLGAFDLLMLAAGDSLLGSRAASGAAEAADAAELRRLLEELHADSYAWSVACCRGDATEATEVLQTAYVKVLSGEARFERLSSAKTWFFGVVRRTAQERRRRALLTGRIFAVLAQTAAPPRSERPLQDATVVLDERARTLRAALGRLPERQRQVLTLVFAHDMTLDETGRTLGIAPGSARAHYERGKKRLRALLGESESWNE